MPILKKMTMANRTSPSLSSQMEEDSNDYFNSDNDLTRLNKSGLSLPAKIDKLHQYLQTKTYVEIYFNNEGIITQRQAKLIEINSQEQMLTFTNIRRGIEMETQTMNIRSFLHIMNPDNFPKPPNESILERYFNFPNNVEPEHNSMDDESVISFQSQTPQKDLRINQISREIHYSFPTDESTDIGTYYAKLPLTNNGSVDKLYIETMRQAENSPLDFSQYCLSKGYTQEMVLTSNDFDFPETYKDFI